MNVISIFNLNDKQKKTLLNLIVSTLVLILVVMIDHLTQLNAYLKLLLYLIPYYMAGRKTLKSALRGIKNKMPMDENLLMSIATLGALYIGEYPEAVMVFVLYELGELFQDIAVNRSRNSIKSLLDIAPKKAYIVDGDDLIESDPDDIEIGTVLIVRKGDVVPIDSLVIEGSTSLDTSSINGESLPIAANVDDHIYSGSINLENNIFIKTTKSYDDSMVSKIIELVENATDVKSKHEKFITKFARFYTPMVVIAAIALAIIPSLIFGNFDEYFFRACTFLVISCPCALVISVPLSFFGGIGRSSKAGILIKGSNYLEGISNVEVLVSDKTGTITNGKFVVSDVINESTYSNDEIMSLAARLEATSSHPIALSIIGAYNNKIEDPFYDVEVISGMGIIKDDYAIGNRALLEKIGVKYKERKEAKTIIYLVENKKVIARFIIEDQIKQGTKKVIEELNNLGINKTVILSGDNKNAVANVALKLGISEYHGDMLPQDKVDYIKSVKEKNIYIGDGINDAPVLKNAYIGLAMGAMGSDVAIDAADIVITDDDLAKIPVLIKIANKTMNIVKTNITFIIAVKFLLLVFGALGYVNMWMAVFGDVGLSVIAIINSMRILSFDYNR